MRSCGTLRGAFAGGSYREGACVGRSLTRGYTHRQLARGPVANTVQAAVANASQLMGTSRDGSEVVVKEAWVGKGQHMHRVRFHAKGRTGKMEHPFSHLTVILERASGQGEAVALGANAGGWKAPKRRLRKIKLNKGE